jgi:polyhydroxybutyrate depolymerase
VFATGNSFGGFMTNRLGFARASRLRAIAPAAGGLAPHDCGGRPMAALVVHASNDSSVDFAEGQAAHAMWMTAARCRQTTQPFGEGPCVLHDGCAPEAPVGFCVHRRGHTFPPFATAAIWSFFDRQR